MAVRQALRIAGAVVAVGLLGYAVVTLTGEPAAPASSAAAKRAKPERSNRAAAAEADTDAPAEHKAVARKRGAVDGPRPVAGPPPVAGVQPEPIPFDQARREFETLVHDVEDMAAREEHLPHEEWIGIYRKGDLSMVALLRASAEADEADRSANAKLNERFRTAVMKIQPTPRAN
jgi:hypothetical protein